MSYTYRHIHKVGTTLIHHIKVKSYCHIYHLKYHLQEKVAEKMYWEYNYCTIFECYIWIRIILYYLFTNN